MPKRKVPLIDGPEPRRLAEKRLGENTCSAHINFLHQWRSLDSDMMISVAGGVIVQLSLTIVSVSLS